MPYVDQQTRSELTHSRPETPGELTYLLYKECVEYLNHRRDGARYEDYAAVLGSLEATKMELYRQRLAPYEDKKLLEHGDVDDD